MRVSAGTLLDKTTYTVDELAALLKINRKTVIRLIASEKLGAFRVGREYRITEEDYQAYRRKYKVIPKDTQT